LGVLDGPLPFDRLTDVWHLVQLLMLAVLGGALWLVSRDPPRVTAAQSRLAGPRSTRRTPAPPSRRHLRRIV
jgi:hypothetical protein